MTTEAEINEPLPIKNIDWVTVRAVIGLLAIVQLLLLSIYFDYAPGFLITSLALGSLAFYLVSILSRTREVFATDSFSNVEELGQIGDDLFDDLPVPMINADESGNILQANTAACSLIGHDDLIGASLETIVEGLGRSIRDRMADTSILAVSRQVDTAHIAPQYIHNGL